MKLFSYVVARDYGFAPNPFFGVCTLATCKPGIRKSAAIGDIILGTGSAEHDLQGRVVYIMQVEDALTFDEYWADERYRCKRPVLSSLKKAYGDNVYHRDPETGNWIQEDSHHSYENGQRNDDNVATDTQTDRVLISRNFTYWGNEGPPIPEKYRNWGGEADICAQRNYKNKFSKEMIVAFFEWYNSIVEKGFLFDPHMFSKLHEGHI